jgi:hypothetical protein
MLILADITNVEQADTKLLKIGAVRSCLMKNKATNISDILYIFCASGVHINNLGPWPDRAGTCKVTHVPRPRHFYFLFFQQILILSQ